MTITNIPIGPDNTHPFDPLERSKLATTPQMEAMGGDLDLKAFNVEIDRVGGLELRSAITDATITRTIEGASTLTITVNDDNGRTIQKSGRLGRQTWVNIDGLWFAFVGVTKNGNSLNLTFEDREVNLLRHYDTFIKGDRTKVTRAEFALRMIQEVTQVKLSWVIPELHDVQPKNDLGVGQTLVDSSGQAIASNATLNEINGQRDKIARQQGIDTSGPAATDLTVKGVKATKEQIENGNTVLRVGIGMKARSKVLVASIQTGIAESLLRNLPGQTYQGHLINSGIYQQDSRYWPASGNVVIDAQAWFDRAIQFDNQYPNASYQALCQGVQHSAFADGSNYAPWQAEAEKFVNEFGQSVPPENNSSTGGADPLGNNQGSPNGTNGGAQYFIRGRVSQARGSNGAYILEKQNSWDCLQSLANDVNWRCFVVSGTVYFISEAWLFRSQPFMTINEDSTGIDWINYDYDVGKKVATVNITAHLSRWSAPPGSIIKIKGQSNIVDGRYIVNTVSRSIFDTIATITLKKPLPQLPEPTSLTGIPSGFLGASGGANDVIGNQSATAQASQYGATGSLVQPVPSPYNRGHGVQHDTLGLPGYPAYDFFAIPGSPVVAVEAGTVLRISGHDPATGWHDKPGEAIGWSIYLTGESGSIYYYTHLQNLMVKKDDVVPLGKQMAEVVVMPGVDSHTHLGVSAAANGYTLQDIGNAPVPVLIR